MSNPSRVAVSGPLSVFAAGFREELLERGYRPGTVTNQLQLMAHLSRWMTAHGSEPAALGCVEIARFAEERRASHVQLASARALEPLLGYLRGLGVVPPHGSREAATPAGELLDRYAEYLLVRRGLKPSTVRNCCNHVRALLADRERVTGALALDGLDVAASTTTCGASHGASVSPRRRQWPSGCGRCCASCTWRG
jgi:integrase/recombinase XerD